MAHRWEALIDFPWGKSDFEVSVDILVHNAASRYVCLCNVKEQEQQRANTGEGGMSGPLCVGCKLLVCFLFWVEWKAALWFIFEARDPK